jgi:hypothetical protein
LNDLDVSNPSALDFNYAGNMRRSISVMVPAAVDPDDSQLLHDLAVFLVKGTILLTTKT